MPWQCSCRLSVALYPYCRNTLVWLVWKLHRPPQTWWSSGRTSLWPWERFPHMGGWTLWMLWSSELFAVTKYFKSIGRLSHDAALFTGRRRTSESGLLLSGVLFNKQSSFYPQHVRIRLLCCLSVNSRSDCFWGHQRAEHQWNLDFGEWVTGAVDILAGLLGKLRVSSTKWWKPCFPLSLQWCLAVQIVLALVLPALELQKKIESFFFKNHFSTFHSQAFGILLFKNVLFFQALRTLICMCENKAFCHFSERTL